MIKVMLATLTAFSKRHEAIKIAAVLIALSFLQGCCCRQVSSIQGPVPVPVKSEKIVFSMNQKSDANMEELVAAVSCLIRTGSAEKSACDNQNVSLCTLKTDSEVRSEYRQVVSSLQGFEFTSIFAFNNAIRKLLGTEAIGSVDVADARRTDSCKEWTGEGSCGAFRYKDLWFLLKRSDPNSGPVQEVEVFLVGMPCREEVPHVDAR